MRQQPLTKVMQLPARGQITIPTEFRRQLGLDEGSLLRIRLVGKKIEIEPLKAAEDVLRLYSDSEIEQFMEEDRIDAETAAKVRKLLNAGEL
jgi:AbrB family looped-hinge helix DNA binding protein